MAVPNKKNAAELQRIIKETTGREVSTIEVYTIWHYLQKVLLCSGLWKKHHEPPRRQDQPSLFEELADRTDLRKEDTG